MNYDANFHDEETDLQYDVEPTDTIILANNGHIIVVKHGGESMEFRAHHFSMTGRGPIKF